MSYFVVLFDTINPHVIEIQRFSESEFDDLVQSFGHMLEYYVGISDQDTIDNIFRAVYHDDAKIDLGAYSTDGLGKYIQVFYG